MIDILVLIVIPVVLLSICIVCMVQYTNKIATSNELKYRIIKISKRPRVIRDNNHRLSHVNRLMIPANEEEFVNDMVDLLRKSYRISNTNIL